MTWHVRRWLAVPMILGLALMTASCGGDEDGAVAATLADVPYAAMCNLEQQRRFFRAHLQPWVEQMCDVVEAHPQAITWRAVAGLTRCFVQIETQAFDLLEL